MHRALTTPALTFALILLPLHVFATPQAQPAPAGHWSIGAGMSFGAIGGLGLTQMLGGLGVSTATPRLVSPHLSLERRAGDRLSFLLGLSGSLSEQNTGPESRGASVTRPDIRSRSGGLALSFGLRYAFVEGPATVSGYALLSGGYSAVSESGETMAPIDRELVPYSYQADIFGGGLEVGLAVERRFTEVFALRISTSLGRIEYSNQYAKLAIDEGVDRTETAAVGSGIQAMANVTPALEARLYF